jgi:hypothetical protein
MLFTPLLLLTFLSFFLNTAKADPIECVLATDTFDDTTAAGYMWQAVRSLKNSTQTPRIDENFDTFFVNDATFGGINLDMKVKIPRKRMALDQLLYMSIDNKDTVKWDTKEKIYTAYRLAFILHGQEDYSTDDLIKFLINDVENCVFNRSKLGFAAEDVAQIDLQRLVLSTGFM